MNGRATSSAEREDQEDCGDYPVHKNLCLWIEVEKWFLISIAALMRLVWPMTAHGSM